MKKSGKKISFFKKSGNNHGTPILLNLFKVTIHLPIMELRFMDCCNSAIFTLGHHDMMTVHCSVRPASSVTPDPTPHGLCEPFTFR